MFSLSIATNWLRNIVFVKQKFENKLVPESVDRSMVYYLLVFLSRKTHVFDFDDKHLESVVGLWESGITRERARMREL